MLPRQLRFVRLSLVACLLLLAVSSVASAIPAQAAERAEPSGGTLNTLSTDGFKTIPYPGDTLAGADMATVAGGKGASARLDAALQALADGGLATADAQVARDDGGRVQVQVSVSPDQLAAATAAMTSLGGSVTGQSLDKTLIQGFMPVANLKALANQGAVQYVAAPETFTGFGELQVGATTTEGVAISNATSWHNAGFRGAGVKVAIIDGGFQGYNTLLGSDLPAAVTAVNFADTGTVTDGGPHGTACAEIVYDMAPGATYYLIRIASTIDLQEAVTYAIAQGVRVISVSGGFYNTSPGDGTGFLANEVQRAANAGILWANAASNDREAHWSGPYVDSNGNNFHEFGGYEINCYGPTPGSCYGIPPGYLIVGYLRWNNWTAPVNQDYDIAIVRLNTATSPPSWQIVATSTNFQNGGAGQRPTEAVGYISSGASTAYGFLIRRYSASGSAHFDLFTPKVAPLMVRTAARSLSSPGDAPAALTVAALNSVPPYAQEPYSSEGPTNGPGGTAAGGFIKPDLSAWANVNTRAYGTTAGSKFNGTSAATPHVGGALALVRGAYPNYSWSQVRSFLFGRAIDIGVGGRDNQFGYGRLWLGPPKLLRYDFNGDKRADILWRHIGTGSNAVWFLNGGVLGTASLPSVASLSWTIGGGGDFDGNGRSDILWRNVASGANAIWFMNGATVVSGPGIAGVSTSWRVVATGDFNGDARSDIVWRNATTGAIAIWFMNGSTILSGPGVGTVPLSWLLVGTGDFNADGRADILWRHSSGANTVWLMNGASIGASVALPSVTDANWRIVGTGDRNNDGRSDILWRNFGTGSNSIWYMNGGTVLGSAGVPGVADTRWQVMHDGDVNGDGRADIVWRHAVSGSNAAWVMNGGSVVGSVGLPAVPDARWRIQGNATAGTHLASIEEATAEAAASPEELVVSGEIVTLEVGPIGEALVVEPSDDAPVADETLVDTPETGYKTYLMLIAR